MISAINIVLFILVIVLIIGVTKTLKRYNDIKKTLEFSTEYLNKFVQLRDSYDENIYNQREGPKLNYDLHTWLTLKVNKMERLLGRQGRMHYIFGNISVPNYSIIINTLPKFRDRSLMQFDVNSTEECLKRYIGSRLDYLEEGAKQRWNPLIWFREGMKEIVGFPFIVMYYFGLIQQPTIMAIKRSFIFNLITFLVSLIGLLASIVTILAGYDGSIAFLYKMLDAK